MLIVLTQGKYAIVGPQDYEYLMRWKWYYVEDYKDGYAVRGNNNCLNRKLIRMSRVILERMGYKDFAHSNHINRNTLDNRRCNLRPQQIIKVALIKVDEKMTLLVMLVFIGIGGLRSGKLIYG